MLKPLEQFICDECGQVINSPKEGYVERESGTDANGKMFARGFRIVHAAYASPLAIKVQKDVISMVEAIIGVI